MPGFWDSVCVQYPLAALSPGRRRLLAPGHACRDGPRVRVYGFGLAMFAVDEGGDAKDEEDDGEAPELEHAFVGGGGGGGGGTGAMVVAVAVAAVIQYFTLVALRASSILLFNNTFIANYYLLALAKKIVLIVLALFLLL